MMAAFLSSPCTTGGVQDNRAGNKVQLSKNENQSADGKMMQDPDAM